MNKSLNLKNMINEYVNADPASRLNLWNSFRTMRAFGFISWEHWCKFYDTCKDLEIEVDMCDLICD